MSQKIIEYASQLVFGRNAKTMTAKDIQAAVQLVLPTELAKHAVSDATKSITKFNYTILNKGKKEDGNRAKPVQKSVRAGLQFPVSRVANIMKVNMKNTLLGRGATIYLAAVLEYLTAEILEIAGNVARDNKRARINTRHLVLAIRNDIEFKRLLKEIVMSGGVVF